MKKTQSKNTKKISEDRLHKIPLRITDTTLRDSHQSLWATRMRTDDIMKIIDTIDSVGYYSLEVWGGATFDVCMRFLRENPWERLRLIKSKAKKTPLQMLLRGQNLVGYRNYADDVVDRFVAHACENGIDIFRVFDALNDSRNLASAVKAVKRHGGHAQGTLAYTISPVHTIEKYVEYAKQQCDLGIDSICIKDMAGILSPIRVQKLVSALVKEAGVPVQLHCHATSGMATATYVEGVRVGAGAIDCAISSMAGFSSQPPVETLAAIFEETNYAAHLDFSALERVADYFEKLAPVRRQKSAPKRVIDPGILRHQIPGGMISNFHSQLEMQGALDKLPEALKEVELVRKDLGYPPLVTPTSQIVGTQAVMNVLSGERYKIVPNEVKNYLKGMYGRAPGTIKKSFLKQILGNEKPITHRPADIIKNGLPRATDGIDSKLIENEEDIISYCILPESALEYFKWRSLDPVKRDPIPADVEFQKMMNEESGDKLSADDSKDPAPVKGALSGPEKMIHDDDYRGMSILLKGASGLGMDELSVKRGDFSLTMRTNAGGGPGHVDRKNVPGVENEDIPHTPSTENKSAAISDALQEKKETRDSYSHTVKSPLVGTFYSSSGPGKERLVEEGNVVKAGDKVCIVEAMKLFNEITSPEDCKIVKYLVKDGDGVEKGQPLIAYEPV